MFHYPGQSVARHSVYMILSSSSSIPAVYLEPVLFLIPLQCVNLFCNLSHVYLAVLLIYFISAAVILLASLALIVHVSLPYNKTGRASRCRILDRKSVV